MQERAYARRGEQYLLIKSPPASGKSRALMFIALDKLHNQGVQAGDHRRAGALDRRQLRRRAADASTASGPTGRSKPQWNLCNAPGIDEPRVAKSKVKAVGEFLASDDRVLVCTHATFRFAVEELGVEAFDDRLIAVDEFHHVSANPDNRLGSQLGAVHRARQGAHRRDDRLLFPRRRGSRCWRRRTRRKFETVTYTYYEQLNGYEHLKSLDIGYFFYTGRYLDAIMKVLDPALKTIVHIPNVNSRESTEGQAQGSRRDHGRARRVEGRRPGDRLPPDRADGRPDAQGRRPGRRCDAAKRDRGARRR